MYLEHMIKATFFSRLAYKKNNRIKEELKESDYCAVLINDISIENPHKYLFDDDKTLRMLIIDDTKTNERFFIFRGSNNISNWVTNVRFGKTAVKGGKVHTGFHLASDKCIEPVMDYMDKNKLLITAGHSLGGALAMGVMEKCALDYCRTIGSPKYGDDEYCLTYHSKRYERIEHDLDPVPYMPPAILGYNTLGNLFYINRNKEILINPSWHYMRRDSLIARIKRQREGFLATVYDHDFDLYLKHLNINHRKAKNKQLPGG